MKSIIQTSKAIAFLFLMVLLPMTTSCSIEVLDEVARGLREFESKNKVFVHEGALVFGGVDFFLSSIERSTQGQSVIDMHFGFHGKKEVRHSPSRRKVHQTYIDSCQSLGFSTGNGKVLYDFTFYFSKVKNF